MLRGYCLGLLVFQSAFCADVSLSISRTSVGDAPSAESGVSLLQRWATSPHTLELRDDQLTSYIATGQLPPEALTQLQSSSAKPAKTETQTYKEQAKNVLLEMQEYETKLDTVRSKAMKAYKKVAAQEKRLSANFVPVKKMLRGLIQKAATTAAKAEAQTMLERLTRMHYRQVSSLDRSATYWLEVQEREMEARRAAQARLALIEDKLQFELVSSEERGSAMKKTREEDQAKNSEWFNKYWAELEQKEKAALEKETPFNEKEQKEVISMLNKYITATHKAAEPSEATPEDAEMQEALKAIANYPEAASTQEEPKLVAVNPGEIVPHS